MTNTVSGVPFLGDVPLLRYLFSTEHAERQETEVLVMLTPRVVRLPEPPLGARSNVTLAGEPRPAGPSPYPGLKSLENRQANRNEHAGAHDGPPSAWQTPLLHLWS